MAPLVEPIAVGSPLASSSETITLSPSQPKRHASANRNTATGVASVGSSHPTTSGGITRRTPSSGSGTMVEARILALENSSQASPGSADDPGTKLASTLKMFYNTTIHTQAR
ncbi:unnamed protein product, partial [Sphacelaria rigidula]